MRIKSSKATPNQNARRYQTIYSLMSTSWALEALVKSLEASTAEIIRK